jgi:hypothetical protein
MCVVMISCASPTPLEHTHTSIESLATAVLDGLARNDRHALETLELTEAEFKAHVWPHLPASRPERNLPFSYVWNDLRQKSRDGLTLTLRARGGKQYHLVGARFAGESTRYGVSEVHRETVLTVRDERGNQQDIRIFGSSIEEGGRWKIFSYVVD